MGSWRDWVDISAIQLPILFFQGGEEDLPVVFERLNTTGTNLNRYDVLAASWVHTRTLVINKKVQGLIEGKYKDLEDRGYEVSRKPTDDDSDYNLYEYLFGLGRLLAADYPRLFGALGDSAETPSYGFTLATVANGLRLSRLPELPSQMRGSADLIDPTDFEKALLESVSFVDKTLRPYLDIKLNSSRQVDVVHAEYQMAALILATLSLRFDRESSWTQRSTWPEVRDALEKQLPRHYLIDILEDNWRGSGDSLLFRRVWAADEHGVITGPAGHYNTPVPKERVEESIDEWFEDDQMQRLMIKRQYVRPVEKVFLRYVYTGVVTLLDEFGTRFDLEHLFPVGRLVEAIAKANAGGDAPEGWPISCISNLALLDFRLNRQKGKLTISEAIDALATEAEKASAQEKLNHLLLCDLSEVAIPKENGADALSCSHYDDFLRGRFQTMRTQVIKNLNF